MSKRRALLVVEYETSTNDLPLPDEAAFARALRFSREDGIHHLTEVRVMMLTEKVLSDG